jgi:uncharacterized protein YbbK (DUF523 family)
VQNNPTILTGKHRLGISQCLLGDRVRYDGASIADSVVLEKLAALFELVAICPEVEAGFGVPRPAVQLSGDLLEPRVTGRDDPTLDVTARLTEYTQARLASLAELNGYVFKSRSPSCGLNSTPVFVAGVCITEASRGVFARAVCQRYPDLPVIEDSELDSTARIVSFIDAVYAHYTSQRS